MKAIQTRHSGFLVRFSMEAVQAMAFGLGAGADLRAVDRWAGRVADHLLHEACRALGDQFLEGNRFDFELSVDVSAVLGQRLKELLSRRPLNIRVVSPTPGWEAALTAALGGIPAVIRVVAATPARADLRPPCLLLRDLTAAPLQARRPSPDRLDNIVRARLVTEMDAATISDAWDDMDPPIPASGDAPALVGAGPVRLLEAVAMARFSAAWGDIRGACLRWRLRESYSFDPKANRVDVSLDLEAEERILVAEDLHMGTAWCDLPKERLADLAGHDEAKRLALGDIAWLRDPSADPGLRAHIVDGPPGSGKSLFCAGVAGEAEVAFMRITASEWLGMWWGETEKSIRKTFQALGRYDACVLVVEEFEGVAFDRERASMGNPAYYASMLGTLLTCLDQVRRGSARVLLLATTNHHDQLDPAVVRSMRMGQRLHLGWPVTADRRALLAIHLAGPMSGGDLDEAAQMTSGLSQADLVALAGQYLAGSGSGLAPFQALVLAHRMGPRSPGARVEGELAERIALHEAGHALVAFHLLGPGSVEHLSLVPTVSGAGGMFVSRPWVSSRTPIGGNGIRHYLTVALAGRAAESLAYPNDGGAEGAAEDIRKATEIAVAAIGEMGLEPGFSTVAFSALPETVRFCLAPRFAGYVQAWIAEAETKALEVLQANMPILKALARALVQAETLHRARILEIIEAGEKKKSRGGIPKVQAESQPGSKAAKARNPPKARGKPAGGILAKPP